MKKRELLVCRREPFQDRDLGDRYLILAIAFFNVECDLLGCIVLQRAFTNRVLSVTSQNFIVRIF